MIYNHGIQLTTVHRITSITETEKFEKTKIICSNKEAAFCIVFADT